MLLCLEHLWAFTLGQWNSAKLGLKKWWPRYIAVLSLYSALSVSWAAGLRYTHSQSREAKKACVLCKFTQNPAVAGAWCRVVWRCAKVWAWTFAIYSVTPVKQPENNTLPLGFTAVFSPYTLPLVCCCSLSSWAREEGQTSNGLFSNINQQVPPSMRVRTVWVGKG